MIQAYIHIHIYIYIYLALALITFYKKEMKKGHVIWHFQCDYPVQSCGNDSGKEAAQYTLKLVATDG